MLRISAEKGRKYGANRRSRNLYSIFYAPYLCLPLSVPTSFLRRRVFVFRDLNLRPRDFSSPTRVAFSCRPPHRRFLCFCYVVAPSNTHSPFVQLAAMNDDSCNNKSNNNISNFCIPAIIACPSRRMRSMLGTAANTIVATTPC